ncbi:tetratricopeptide repeat protein [Cystobacter fuscus]
MKGCAADSLAAASEGRLDEALVLARRKADTCSWARFLAGDLLSAREQFEEASTFLERDLVSKENNRRSVDLLVQIFPRLSPERQAQLAALGASREAPLHVWSVPQIDAWITQVVCRERRLDKVDSSDRRAWGLGSMSFECPPGVARQVFFFLHTEGPYLPPPTPSEGIAVERVLPALSSRYGIRSVEALHQAVVDPLEVDRSTAWLVSWIHDYPSASSLWTQLLRDNPDDLEAALHLGKIQAELGDLKGALQTLDSVTLDSATVKDTRSGVMGTSSLSLFVASCSSSSER